MNHFGAMKVARHCFRIKRGDLTGRAEVLVEGFDSGVEFTEIFEVARVHGLFDFCELTVQAIRSSAVTSFWGRWNFFEPPHHSNSDFSSASFGSL
jgi:hypothetical protein